MTFKEWDFFQTREPLAQTKVPPPVLPNTVIWNVKVTNVTAPTQMFVQITDDSHFTKLQKDIKTFYAKRETVVKVSML